MRIVPATSEPPVIPTRLTAMPHSITHTTSLSKNGKYADSVAVPLLAADNCNSNIIDADGSEYPTDPLLASIPILDFNSESGRLESEIDDPFADRHEVSFASTANDTEIQQASLNINGMTCNVFLNNLVLRADHILSAGADCRCLNCEH